MAVRTETEYEPKIASPVGDECTLVRLAFEALCLQELGVETLGVFGQPVLADARHHQVHVVGYLRQRT